MTARTKMRRRRWASKPAFRGATIVAPLIPPTEFNLHLPNLSAYPYSTIASPVQSSEKPVLPALSMSHLHPKDLSKITDQLCSFGLNGNYAHASTSWRPPPLTPRIWRLPLALRFRYDAGVPPKSTAIRKHFYGSFSMRTSWSN
ncbi:hypothetical protein NITLEN_80076 [Nitrospira lenta]|uniref:Uncharacterized protein n=1 Tax=Nitrospira lenta TaxID=1436998 RepID=A0A330LBG4_9BACT|nr:hypothetical protein NITLEN_80076 [Nitrospira lenta]